MWASLPRTETTEGSVHNRNTFHIYFSIKDVYVYVDNISHLLSPDPDLHGSVSLWEAGPGSKTNEIRIRISICVKLVRCGGTIMELFRAVDVKN